DEIGDAGTVLRDAYPMPARDTRIAVRHMSGTLFMRGRDEADAGGREEIERIHIGGAGDAEDILDAIGDQRFDEGFGGGHFGHCGTAGQGKDRIFPYSGIWTHESASSGWRSGPECPQPEEGRVLDPARHALEGGIPRICAESHAPDHPSLAFADGRYPVAHRSAFEDDHGIGRCCDHTLALV